MPNFKLYVTLMNALDVNFYGFLLDEFGMLSCRVGFSATAELSCNFNDTILCLIIVIFNTSSGIGLLLNMYLLQLTVVVKVTACVSFAKTSSRRLQFESKFKLLTDVRYCVSTSDNTVPKNRGNCGIAVLNSTVKPTVLVP